jgi:Fe-S-cluster-containing dehydrogenase component/formate-dependent nitrite reductase membrane component NrfD
MNYGFVIDNRKCIGCHACSTACKSENDVPLGVNRTWVKYTETGQYPDVNRHFQVNRCNHCANPPCVRICPVTAMYQRDNGIVEFDSDVCIGCKACIQACPYDAIHMDPETGTAAKCHYCSHRTEIGLEPACVVVCPEHAIISGDMDDSNSEISRYLAKEEVVVRKPEQGTAPKLFYVEGHAAGLHPTAAAQEPETFMWHDLMPNSATATQKRAQSSEVKYSEARSGVKIRLPDEQGNPKNGPVQLGGSMAEQMVQVGFNAQHKIYWHWQVPAYIVTKDIASGIFMLLAILFAGGFLSYDSNTVLTMSVASVMFTLITTALLVGDLEKPLRFLSIVLRPQMKSWLARGAFILILFSTLSGLFMMGEVAQKFNLMSFDALRQPWLIVTFPLAFMASIYTAFLFGQAEGRDLWQHPLLPVQLLIRSVLAAAAVMLLLYSIFDLSLDGFVEIVGLIFVGTLVIDTLLSLLCEFGMPHATEVAAAAAADITKGRYKKHFWEGYITLGRIVPLCLIWVSFDAVMLNVAAVLGLIGLAIMEYIFVMAPQYVPNS